VPGDQGHGAGEEGLAGLHARPWRGAGWVRKRDEIEVAAVKAGKEAMADDFIHTRARDEALYGEAADGDDEVGLEQEDFLAKPLGAIFDLGRIWNPVAAGGDPAREAAANGGHVNVGTEHLLIDSGPLLKPTEEAFAGSPGEGASEDGFSHAGGLAYEEDAAKDGAAGDGRRFHLWTKTAGEEIRDVGLKKALPSGAGTDHWEPAGGSRIMKDFHSVMSSIAYRTPSRPKPLSLTPP